MLCSPFIHPFWPIIVRGAIECSLLSAASIFPPEFYLSAILFHYYYYWPPRFIAFCCCFCCCWYHHHQLCPIPFSRLVSAWVNFWFHYRVHCAAAAVVWVWFTHHHQHTPNTAVPKAATQSFLLPTHTLTGYSQITVQWIQLCAPDPFSSRNSGNSLSSSPALSISVALCAHCSKTKLSWAVQNWNSI